VSALTDSSKLAKWAIENDLRLMNIQVKPKSDKKNWRNPRMFILDCQLIKKLERGCSDDK
jgi:hypothetical protein